MYKCATQVKFNRNTAACYTKSNNFKSELQITIQGKIPATMSYKFNTTCLKCSLAAVLLLLLQTAFSQSNYAELDKAFQEKQDILGKDLVVLLWEKDDTIVFKKEMGAFNSKTVAPIASASKWLTAALVMQLVEEGKLSLDDNISRYLPEFEKYGKNYITLRHCLSHLTGIDDEGRLLKKLIQRKKFASLEEEVNSFAARDIRTNPGTDFWYGNVGLNIAARVVEVVSKKKFDLLIRQKLFVPLTMRKTTFSTLDGSAVNPSGGARSTADDYMKFLVMLLNKGSYAGKQILSEESVNELMKIQTSQDQIKYAPKSASGFNYALGSWSLLPASSKGGGEGNAQATALASPGLFGTWPMIDVCRGYAYLVFVKNILGEERADIHLEMKKIIDKQMPGECN